VVSEIIDSRQAGVWARKSNRGESLSDITTLAEFIRRIEARSNLTTRSYLYRGNDTCGHSLCPSLFRKKEDRKHEKNIFRELVSMHPTEFAQDNGVFEQLVRMQHFSLPTRLLDITYNPLIALYFCCRSNPKRDGEFIRIVVPKRSVRYFDSDTVSCISNLANLSGSERDALRKLGTDADLRESEVGKRLLHFIKSEKPQFLPLIRMRDLQSVVAVRPRQTNRRLLAQQGAFLLFGLQTDLADDNDFDLEISRIVVPATSKAKLLASLDRVNVNESTVFPEIDYAARYVMSKVASTAS
jgi:hypothetical protein